MQDDIKTLLEGVSKGTISVGEALSQIKIKPFEELGFAKVDTARKVRCGAGEVIYGAGKTAPQIVAIAGALLESGEEKVLITRMGQDVADEVAKSVSFRYDKVSRIGVVSKNAKQGESSDSIHAPLGKDGSYIAVATGGTSDLSVAEEAAQTAEFLGCNVRRIYDVGVAGIHRLLSHVGDFASARVVIAVAGMEGALASVIGGLVDCPVIAVPTSVGYGASFGGVSALLAMLNSCASGVSVVNIDNGFGAGYLAARIDRIGKLQ